MPGTDKNKVQEKQKRNKGPTKIANQANPEEEGHPQTKGAPPMGVNQYALFRSGGSAQEYLGPVLEQFGRLGIF